MDLLLYAEQLDGDLLLGGGDLVSEAGLRSAVLLSLFLDSYAEDVALDDRRGWWADDLTDRVGSQLWLLEREKASTENAERARIFTQDALEWMVRDGIAETIEVVATYQRPGQLDICVEIKRGAARAWGQLWESPLEFDASWSGGQLTVNAN